MWEGGESEESAAASALLLLLSLEAGEGTKSPPPPLPPEFGEVLRHGVTKLRTAVTSAVTAILSSLLSSSEGAELPPLLALLAKASEEGEGKGGGEREGLREWHSILRPLLLSALRKGLDGVSSSLALSLPSSSGAWGLGSCLGGEEGWLPPPVSEICAALSLCARAAHQQFILCHKATRLARTDVEDGGGGMVEGEREAAAKEAVLYVAGCALQLHDSLARRSEGASEAGEAMGCSLACSALAQVCHPPPHPPPRDRCSAWITKPRIFTSLSSCSQPPPFSHRNLTCLALTSRYLPVPPYPLLSFFSCQSPLHPSLRLLFLPLPPLPTLSSPQPIPPFPSPTIPSHCLPSPPLPCPPLPFILLSPLSPSISSPPISICSAGGSSRHLLHPKRGEVGAPRRRELRTSRPRPPGGGV